MDAAIETEDWIVVDGRETIEPEFVGYDILETSVKIIRYRKITQKGRDLYQLVFDRTPFYAESGGQIGDSGFIQSSTEKFPVINTLKEHNLTLHLVNKLPVHPEEEFTAVVNVHLRTSTANNHTATHLLHHALRNILGTHVEQKGSLVHPDYLRFDFSHFQKVSDEEIRAIEKMVNKEIRQNLALSENRAMPVDEALETGAMALFGEKYGDHVRVIRFGDSVELCGGTHVQSTGQIGFFKITRESAIAAGIRRIEAVTGDRAEEFIFRQNDTIATLENMLSPGKNIIESVEKIMLENNELAHRLEELEKEKLIAVKSRLKNQGEMIGNILFIGAVIDVENAGALRDLSYQLKGELDNMFLILGCGSDGKANLSIMISDSLVKEKHLNASALIREFAAEIRGGGGGQDFYATAGGKDPDGLQRAVNKAKELITKL